MGFGTPPTEAGIANVKIGELSRNASGTQSITGLGFKPKTVIFFARRSAGETAHMMTSFGYDDGASHLCMFTKSDSTLLGGTDEYSIMCFLSDTDYIAGRISQMDNDGFTITWDMAGSETVDVEYLAMK